jgi:hypothetical protein
MNVCSSPVFFSGVGNLFLFYFWVTKWNSRVRGCFISPLLNVYYGWTASVFLSVSAHYSFPAASNKSTGSPMAAFSFFPLQSITQLYKTTRHTQFFLPSLEQVLNFIGNRSRITTWRCVLSFSGSNRKIKFEKKSLNFYNVVWPQLRRWATRCNKCGHQQITLRDLWPACGPSMTGRKKKKLRPSLPPTLFPVHTHTHTHTPSS